MIRAFIMLFSVGCFAQLPAFPGAEGGGRFSTGGRGKALAIITTTDYDAPLSGAQTNTHGETYYTGGLHEAMANNSVGYIVFNVSGVFDTGGSLANIYGSPGPFTKEKTIFGQSAPLGGVTITGGSWRWGSNSDNTFFDNMIIRYIRSRPRFDRFGNITISDDGHTWGLLAVNGGDNVIVDHCSFSWAQDKAAGMYLTEFKASGTTMNGVTWSHNLLGDAASGGYIEINPNRPGDPEEDVDQITWTKNVFWGVNRTPNMAFDGDGEVINNIVYDVNTKYTRTYHDIQLNHLSNYFKQPPSRSEYPTSRSGAMEAADVPVIHSSGNYLVGNVVSQFPDLGFYVAGEVNFDGTLNQLNRELWTNQAGTANIANANWTATKFSFAWSNTSEWTPQQAYDSLIVARDVGAYKYLNNNGEVSGYRDAVDARVLTDIETSASSFYNRDVSKWIIPTDLPSNTRPPTYDEDFDGMCDAWEIREFGDLTQGYSGDFDLDGYTNIEEYMNQVDAAAIGPDIPALPTPVTTKTGNTILIAH